MVLRLAVAMALAALAQAHITPLPFVDVTAWTEHDTQQFIHHLPAESQGGWWVRIGDKLFSPSVKIEGRGTPDPNLHHYWLVMGDVDETIKPQVVASDPSYRVNIVHSTRAPTAAHSSLAASSAPTQLRNRLQLFVNVRSRQVAPQDMSLEEDEDLTTALHTITHESYMNEIIRITSIGTGRNVAIAGHTTAEQYLGCRMQQAGLETRFLQFDMRGSKGTDVIGCTKGALDKKFLIVGAHFDTLPAPPEKSPGAMDNGSGVGVVMSSMDALSPLKFKHSVCFTGFDGEELGLLGSHHMANMIAGKDELKDNFLGAITSDMSTGYKEKAGGKRDSGWNKDNTLILRDEPTHSHKDGIHIDGDANSQPLIQLFGQVAKEVVADPAMPILESQASIWNSDQKSFFAVGLQAIDICAANHRVYQYWHHTQNRTENLDPNIGTEISRTTVGAVYQLAEAMGHKSFEEEEEEDHSFPAFDGAMTMAELFGEVDCGAVLAQHEAHSKAVAAKSGAASTPIHDAVMKKKHSQMSLELARQLEESLTRLEAQLTEN